MQQLSVTGLIADEDSCCAFSSSLLVTGPIDRTLQVYNSADFTELPFSPLTRHGYGVHRCCFSSCGSYLLSCSTDGSTMVWEALRQVSFSQPWRTLAAVRSESAHWRRTPASCWREPVMAPWPSGTSLPRHSAGVLQ
ncbi:hypothetical protein CRENBAI_003774 [Crenichthys baileyi]|uniref:Uncharacterized protein n=1 Tax=Crenichthys baileyi TaxID=28760 RepID=A0AAV9QS05_9TELE